MDEFLEHVPPFDEVDAFSELLRIGKDEMNLAEFPMTSLSDRPITSETSLKFEDQIYDERKKRLVIRKRIIEGSKEYGLPTATDDSVILALIQLTKLKNGFTAREVMFTRHELISLLSWPNKGQSYDRIAQSLHRLAGVTYHFENSWWDNRRKTWTTKIFGIIDTVELNDSREADDQGGLVASRIIWNPIILDSFQAGYLRSIDFNLCINFRNHVSMRIYRFMGKRFHLKSDWTFDLKDFAYEHIGLSRIYEGGMQIARKLQPAIEELESVGFLEPLVEDERFLKKGRSWSIRFLKKTPTTSPGLALVEDPESRPPGSITELTDRGVTRATAEELVGKHPAEFIQLKMDVFDWLAGKQDKRIAQNPAGYLVKSISDDYAVPKGFVSKAEQQERQEARQAKEGKAAEDRRRQKTREAREKAESQAIEAYWASMTPEQQAALDAATIEQADPATLAMENGPLKRMGQTIRRHEHIRRLLASREQPIAEG